MKNRELRSLAKSFTYAFRGLFYCIKNERNMRIHLCAVVLVSLFSGVYGLEKSGWLALLLCFGLVIAAEAFNTAIEAMVNLGSPSYQPYARVAKDAAAGAVLVTALAAVGVAAVLFLDDLPRLWATLLAIVRSPLYCPLFLVLILLSVLFIFWGHLLFHQKVRAKKHRNDPDASSR